MPGFDRSGPQGMGPMTGGGRGLCAGGGRRPAFQRGWMGRCHWGGGAFGRGRGFSRWAGTALDADSEMQMLQQEAAYLKNALASVDRRLNELKPGDAPAPKE